MWLIFESFVAPFCRKTAVWKRPKRISTNIQKNFVFLVVPFKCWTVLVFVLCFVFFFFFWLFLFVNVQTKPEDTERHRQRDIESFWIFSSLFLRVPSFDNMRKKLDTRFPAVSLSFFFFILCLCVCMCWFVSLLVFLQHNRLLLFSWTWVFLFSSFCSLGSCEF